MGIVSVGVVTAGIPEKITVELARHNNCSVFVETGTYSRCHYPMGRQPFYFCTHH